MVVSVAVSVRYLVVSVRYLDVSVRYLDVSVRYCAYPGVSVRCLCLSAVLVLVSVRYYGMSAVSVFVFAVLAGCFVVADATGEMVVCSVSGVVVESVAEHVTAKTTRPVEPPADPSPSGRAAALKCSLC